MGFDNSATHLIKDYLSNRLQRVKVNNTLSDWINIQQGVPQGTILGPLLFVIYVNDLSVSATSQVEVLQYADDTMLLASNKSARTAEDKIQTTIQKLTEYFQMNRFQLNVNKTEFIIFSRPLLQSETASIALDIDNELVPNSKHITYLGINIDKNLSFDL